jgi:hypothetical protein
MLHSGIYGNGIRLLLSRGDRNPRLVLNRDHIGVVDRRSDSVGIPAITRTQLVIANTSYYTVSYTNEQKIGSLMRPTPAPNHSRPRLQSRVI